MKANADFSHKDYRDSLSLEDKKILQSLDETAFIANKVKEQTEKLNESLSSKMGIFTKWKK